MISSKKILLYGALLSVLPIGAGYAATFGPDAFGYLGIDSLEPGGPSFSFVDITATGLLVADGDDTSSGPIALGASFDYYGDGPFASLVFSTNGYISSDPTDSGGDLTNDCPLPSPPSTGGGARLYPLHDDLVASTADGGGVYYEYFPVSPVPSYSGGSQGASVVQWVARHFGSTDLFTFEALLYDDGSITYQYGPGNPEGGSGSTTGLQNLAATIGLTIACDTAGSIPDDYAVHIFVPEPTSLILVGIGGLALVAGRRRRR